MSSKKRLRKVTGVTSGAVSTPAPVLSIAPVVTGTATVGSTLSCTTGTWTNTPTSYAYQWLNDGVAISGETLNSYVVQSGDATHQISCQVTAINAGGSASASSNALTIASLVPANTVAPVISGTVTQGQTLSCTTGTWTNSPTGYSYQWKRGVSNIIGANSSTYILTSSDVGSNITCDVTATNAAGNTTATSNSLGPALPLAPTNSVAPVIAGTATVGATLSVTSTGTWANPPTSFTYQWKRGGVAISGETASSYLLTGTDAAANITCAVTASNAGGSASATSNTIGPIASPTITTPVITQTSAAGASPLLFTATLNTTDTFAGNTFRVQVASNTSSDFTTLAQNISHTLTESEVTSGDINITADGFVTPPGAYSLRVRIERDDGVTSSWSNVITGTITSATAQWEGTNGFDKHSVVTVSGTPRLTVVGSSAGYAYVRTTESADPNQFVWEFTISGTPNGERLGMDDRAIDFTSYTSFPAGFSGDGFYIVLSNTSSDLWANNGTLNVSGLTNGALASGDKITCIGNKTTGVVKFKRTRSGTTVDLGSSSGYTITGMASWYIYHGSNAGGGGTLNTGQSAFAYTMTGSEAAFG